MVLIGGPYALTVEGNQASWLPGCIFKYGDILRVQASGTIQWSTSAGSVSPITSIPSAWTLTAATGPITVTFAIPAGVYSAGTWDIATPNQMASSSGNIATSPSNATQAYSFPGGGGPEDSSTAVTAGQLVDVNAAAGGTLTVVISRSTGALFAAVFTLTLSSGSSAGGTAFPEGTYPPTYSSSATFNPSAVLTNAAWPGGTLPVSDCVPVSLAALILEDGVTPGLLNNDLPWSNALQPNRDTTYQASDLFNAGATVPGKNYRIWFLFNDGVSNFAAATGSYAVIINRYAGNPMSQEPLVSLLRPQFGVEAQGAYGTLVAAARIGVNIENRGFDINPDQVVESVGVAGFAFDTDQSLTTEMSKGSVKGMLDYRDFGYILASVYGYTSSTSSSALLSTSAGVSAYIHTFEDIPFNPIPFQSYTYECIKDSSQRAYSVAGIVFTGFKIDTERDKQASLSAAMLGKVINDPILNSLGGNAPSTGTNDVQTLNINGGPTGGTWGLQIDNFPPLTGLAYNIPTATLQTNIRALGGIWSTATVSGTAGTQYVVTNASGIFIPTLVPIYTNALDQVTLTGGTTPTITAVHTTPGGMAIHSFSRVLPGQISVSYAADLTTLVNAPTTLVDEFTTNFDIADRFDPFWRQNTTDVGNGGLAQKDANGLRDSIQLTMAYNNAVAAWIANTRSNTKMWVQIQFTGAALGLTGYNLTLCYQACVIPKWDTFKDSQGNIHSVQLTCAVKHDIPSGFRSRWQITNDVPNYSS